MVSILMVYSLLLLMFVPGSGISAPTEIPGNVLWLDGADVDGDFAPGGSFVGGTTWVDKSTAGNAHASQATAARRPTVVAGALAGRSVVRFDGNNDFMDVSAAAQGMLNGVSGATLFGVVMSTGTSPQAQRTMMISTDVSGRSRAGLNLFDGFGTSLGGSGDFGLAGRRLDSDPFQRIEGGSVSLDTYYHFHGTFDYAASELTLYSMGTQLFSASNFQTPGVTSGTNSANVRIGADADLCDCRGFLEGDIAEFVVYDRVLSAVERAQVEAYFDAKWFGTAPVTYCTPGTTASGCQATLSATGTPSATASTGFTLNATTVEGGKDGLFFFGSNGRQANPWGNGTSFQCVVPPVGRAGLLTGNGTTGQCDGDFAQDLNALWCPGCPKPQKNPGSGALVQAQLWYRDPFNTSNQTTSLSDAIEFCVAP